VARLTEEDLRRLTLGRQFPGHAGRDAAAVLEVFTRLGPLQSQVPRAPFLAASSRLPGVTYATMVALFESHQLLKTSNLRGTVHTSVRAQFGWLDAVARRTRTPMLTRNLGLVEVSAEQVVAEIEAFTTGRWCARADIVAHLRSWLAGRDPGAEIGGTLAENLVWGHSSLVRRPKDPRWEKRTDVFHRLATDLVPELSRLEFPTALTELVRVHLAAYGPVGRDDLALFFGAGLGAVDTAVRALGAEVVQYVGPDGEDYLDLAEPPTGGELDLGVRMLGEFDGLLLGLHGRHRTRFLTAEQLPHLWSKANGLFTPAVLDGDRLVAGWRTLPAGHRTVIEVQMLDPYPPLPVDRFDKPVRAVQDVLGLEVADVRVHPA